jgi:hypothetical protein
MDIHGHTWTYIVLHIKTGGKNNTVNSYCDFISFDTYILVGSHQPFGPKKDEVTGDWRKVLN